MFGKFKNWFAKDPMRDSAYDSMAEENVDPKTTKRYATFDEWNNPSVTKDDLYNSGFYYTSLNDCVKCVFCNVEINGWTEGDVPSEKHTQLSPECPYVKNRTACHERSVDAHLPYNLNLQHESERIKTFKHWPGTTKRAELMSQSGFYYLQVGDCVRCFACGETFHDWQPTDEPDDSHKSLSPKCTFIMNRHISDSDSDEDEVDASKYWWTNKKPFYGEYVLYRKRYDSFRDWPRAVGQDVAALADAGFFYSGVGDKATCYHCGVVLKNWDSRDEPWFEHAKWKPSCYYVRMIKGDAFVEAVERRDKPSSSNATNTKINKTNTYKRTQCKLCHERISNVANIPCGHVVACDECSVRLRTCLGCNKGVHNTVRLYDS